MPKKFPPTKIYLDTSVIVAEDFLRSPSAQFILKTCFVLHITVCVPDVVRDEVVFKFQQKLKEYLDDYKKSERALRRLVSLPAHEDISADQEVSEFEDWLEMLTEEYAIQILPYPKLSLKTLVKESYKGHKPFKTGEKGYKDYLIWHSILADLQKTRKGTKVYFLTNNVNDFCKEKDGVHVLHSDLAKDLREGQKPPVIFTSIKSFFEEILSPQLDNISLSEVPDLTRLDIEEYAEGAIYEELFEKELYGLEDIRARIPFETRITINEIGGAKFNESVSPKKSDNNLILALNGNVCLEIEGFIDKRKYDIWSYSDACDSVRDWDDHYMRISASVETPVEVTLFYSLSRGEFTDHKVILPNEIEYEH